jgi:16S rRNA G966 N2-methylase RsmD
MSRNGIIYSAIFARKEGVNLNNLVIDKECLSYVTNTFDSSKICSIITNEMKKHNKNPKDMVIVDATACVGGDSITFCHNFGIVISIECEQTRYNNLLNNLKVYNLENVYPIFGDSMKLILDLQVGIDVIFIDPPWGGKSYKLYPYLELSFGGFELHEAVKFLFEKREEIKMIVLKLPKNYHYDNLRKKMGDKYTMKLFNFLKKIDIFVITK